MNSEMTDLEKQQMKFLYSSKSFYRIVEKWADGTLTNRGGIPIKNIWKTTADVVLSENMLIRAIATKYKTSEKIVRRVFEDVLDAYCENHSNSLDQVEIT